ncbi:MAG: hypothetical protein E7542_03020 [Ruminococcaceae bacterium]|nr:hypothetical protein [Oscillospiraceae bacterium]
MKRLFSIFLTFITILCLCSCETPENTKTAISYAELVCRSIPHDEWQVLKFKNPENNMALQLSMPDDWKIKPINDNTLNIARNDKVIGIVSTKKLQNSKESFQHNSESKANTDVSMQIDLTSHNKYYRSYQMQGFQNENYITLNMQIDYTELDEDAAYKIMSSVICPPKLASIPKPEETNGAKQILVIGNSFINTSEIGSFLETMLDNDNNGYTVEARSIGMASVITFADNPEICNDIEYGYYSYVFMCGFYSQEDISKFHTIKSACDVSDTKLVIFPAHNESRAVIDAALLEHDDVYFLDWKGEIDALIDTGIDYFDFCMDDYHKHSTPLAGYVGAQMIFTSLFDTPIKEVSDYLPIDADYLDLKLGDYIASGGKIDGYTVQIYNIK